jgi:hypothetical protein
LWWRQKCRTIASCGGVALPLETRGYSSTTTQHGFLYNEGLFVQIAFPTSIMLPCNVSPLNNALAWISC